MVHGLVLAGLLLTGLAALADTGLSVADEEFPFEAEEPDWDVNDGTLVFLSEAPGAVHRHENRLTVTESSFRDGWVKMHQCHSNLDPVDRVEVVYRPQRIRDIQVLDHEQIEEVWVEGHSVQLKGVGRGGRLCVAAETRALSPEGGHWVLRNGPFMRRFLDGYYPMTVALSVELPAGGWEVTDIRPAPQPGFRVERRRAGVLIEAWFEGRLQTELHLRPRHPDP